MIQLKILLTFLFFQPISTTELFEEKYYCGSSRTPSGPKILILGPSEKYLSMEILQNVTGKVIPEDSEKRFSYVLTLSGFLEGSCVTFIELPTLFENQGVMAFSSSDI